MYFERTWSVNSFNTEIREQREQLNDVFRAWYNVTQEYTGKGEVISAEVLRTLFVNDTPSPERIADELKTMLATAQLPQFPRWTISGIKNSLQEPDVSQVFDALSSLRMGDMNANLYCFSFTDEGVDIIPEHFTARLDMLREYARTPEELERLKYAERLRDLMTEIMNSYSYVKAKDCAVPRVLFVENERLEISFHWVQFGRFGEALTDGDLLRKIVYTPTEADTAEFRKPADTGVNYKVSEAEGIAQIVERRNAGIR